ncbi:alpha/beta hydrolase-fold protein [Aquimarina aquimarini]|uniref:alpha/beta hydrolase-fold protein n=1 Tax=Aquimarina aquimarini TaxID=1191734 RepID=UPI000D55A564|nr:alpha/beta hydrolase-fold protein [Aquimarina aquimarini]
MRKIIKQSIFIGLILFFTIIQTLVSQELLSEIKSKPIANIQQFNFESNILEQNIEVNVYLPESYNETSEKHKYPIILLLENEFFYQMTGIVKHLSSVDRMPESIVISFPKGFDKFYAPKVYTNGSNFWPESWKQMPFDGNPDDFTSFLKNELFKILNENYRIANYKMVIGTSVTATYPLHAFCNEPDLFQAHIAISAGDILGMGYTSNSTFVDSVIERIKQEKKQRGHLYICSSRSDVVDTEEIGENLVELHNRIPSDLPDVYKIKSEVYEEETHYGVVIPAFISAMNTFFDQEKWDLDFREFEKESTNTLTNIDAYYKKLSTEYGFQIFPKTNRWNSGSSLKGSGKRLLRKEKNKEALEIFERIVEYTPNTPEAYYDLAIAYETVNQIEDAKNTIIKAIDIAEKHSSESVDKYKKFLINLKTK